MRTKGKIGISTLIIAFVLLTSLMPVFGETYTATSNPAEQAGIADGFRYEIKCKATGLYLNSTDQVPDPANYADVNAITQNNSEEQEWRMEYDSTEDAYRIHIYNETELLDVKSPLVSGANVEIYDKSISANDCQLWVLDYVPDGQHYIIRLKSNPNLVLTCNSTGSVYVSTETTGSEYEYWSVILQIGSMSSNLASGEYYIQNYDTGQFLGAGGGTANDTNVGCLPFVNGGANQKWDVTYLGNGRYVVRPSYSTTLALHVTGAHGTDPTYPAGDESGQNITIYTTGSGSDPDNIANDCEWYIVRDQSDEGTFRLSVQASYFSRCIRVCSTHPTYDVDQHMNSGANYNKWVFIPTSGTYSDWIEYQELGWTYMFSWSTNYDRITSGYKVVRDSGTHMGIDLAGDNSVSIDGKSIISPTTGEVVLEYLNTGDPGYGIVIETNDINPNTGLYLKYACKHLKYESPLEVSDAVSQYQLVGYVGNTGSSTGPHLHFAVIKTNSNSEYSSSTAAVNPQKLFPSARFEGDLRYVD